MNDVSLLERYISRRRWRQASGELMRLLATGVLDVTNYDRWGGYAGRIERGLRTRWSHREKFWRGLSRSVSKAEARANARTHKGLLYFKIGAMSLACGRSFPVSVRWFRMAFEEDTRLYSNPWQQSAYRMMVIVKAFDRFCRAIPDPNVRPKISAIVANNRNRIGRFISAIYDRTVIDPPLLRRVDKMPKRTQDQISPNLKISVDNFRAPAAAPAE